jgi:putative SOS response-associated peptidase YedK
MTEVLSKEKLKDLEAKHPVIMTRKEKLLHWAELVRKAPRQLVIFDGLEHWTPRDLRNPMLSQGTSAFAVAASDEKFKEAGLKDHTPAASMEFFELSQQDLHTFSCNCGGLISNEEMAARIQRLASAMSSV